MIVVSNTSPIINLARIDRLPLLRDLFGELHIPSAVRDEIMAGDGARPGANDIAAGEWVRVQQIRDKSEVHVLQTQLDDGEAEAIVLAQTMRADLLLIDERAGWRIARRRGLRVTGLIGVLIDAKEAGRIDRVRPIVDDLVNVAGFWIAPSFYRQIMEIAQE